MTSLEEKLAELGYEPPVMYMFCKYFTKVIDDNWILRIETDCEATKVMMSYVDLCGENIYSQEQLDELQQVFNQLQKDLEELEDDR